jgi:hypothetical protein
MDILQMSITFLNSAADPDDFWPDPEPTFENARIRILTKINIWTIFVLQIFWQKYVIKSILMNQIQQGFLQYS